jgi:hypothetical protein
MFGLGVNNISALERQPEAPWFTDTNLQLNGTFPSLIHDYTKGRYWNSFGGESGFPVSTVRTTNAKMFNDAGQLVWAPANMIPQSSTAGAVVGVIGSGGAVPTGWAWSSVAGVTREVTAVTPDYIDVRMYGTNPGAITYPQITALNTPLTAVPTETYCGSMFAQILSAPNVSGFHASALKVNTQFLITGSYSNEATPSPTVTTTEQRLVSQGAVTAGANQIRVSFNLTVAASGTVDITVRLGRPQLERQSVNSPQPYINTTGSAIYRERIDYNPQTLAMRGLLVEGSGQNFLPRSHIAATGWDGANFVTLSDSTAQWGYDVVRIAVNAITNPQFTFISGNSFTPSPTTRYVMSLFVKRDNYRYVQITPSANFTGNPPAGAWLNYDFDTNTLQQGGTDAVAASGLAEVLNNGWVRLQIAYTSNAAPVGGSALIIGFPNSLADSRLPICTTNGAAVLAFGMQTEAGEVASSFVPTFGSSITRAADTFVLTPVPWLNQANGTAFVKFIPNKADTTNLRRLFDISDNTANNRVQLGRSTNTTIAGTTSLAGTSDFGPGVANFATSFAVNKAAIEYTPGDKRVVLNGGTLGTNANINVPVSGLTHLTIGSVPGFAAGNTIGGWIQEYRHYPTISASDAQLQALTT